jgi:aspartyl-tRNA(Asn)/glutamyl-tRNA(Gln) amidotransferase subunit A
MTDLTQLTASELSNLYQSGAASPVTVAEQVLAKIERLNPTLNAFCFTDPDTTLKQAQASEHRWQTGQQLSQLDGVPVAVKDSILTQGWPTLHGSLTIDPNQPWLEDAPAVARLREAGAVFVGKTTMPEFNQSWCSAHSNSKLHGIVRNPWNIKCTPGGSSGGSAIAVAAGIVPIAIASDIGGSIAVPAAFCGIVGFKPSFGRVPQYPSSVLSFSTVGPMARSTTDLALILNSISLPDIRDWTSLPYNNIDYTKHSLPTVNGLRVAYCQTIQDHYHDLEIVTAVEQVTSWLSCQGAAVEVVDIDIENSLEALEQLQKPVALQQWQNISVDKRHLTSREFQRRAILSHANVNLYYWLEKCRDSVIKMREFMQKYDVIISPATIVTPDQIAVDAIISENKKTPISPWSVLFSITKQPTLTVPVGLNSNFVPLAVMIAGAMHDDVRVLQVAQAIQQQFPMPACPVIL